MSGQRWRYDARTMSRNPHLVPAFVEPDQGAADTTMVIATVDVSCPRCGRPLHVDLTAEESPLAEAGTTRLIVRPLLPEHDCPGREPLRLAA